MIELRAEALEPTSSSHRLACFERGRFLEEVCVRIYLPIALLAACLTCRLLAAYLPLTCRLLAVLALLAAYLPYLLLTCRLLALLTA